MVIEPQELAAWLRLGGARGVGRTAARRLLAAFGSAQAIFSQHHSALERHISAAQAAALLQPEALQATLLDTTLAWLAESGTDSLERAVVPLGHALYPSALLEIEDPPLLLYLMGAGPLLQGICFPVRREGALAIVGSRNPTPQGRENAQQFAATLRTAGLCIVSGLAGGIDAAAHEGALMASSATGGAATLAVVGTGLDRVYPARHHALARQIAAHGLLISEYPLGTPPLAANFPRRNRIISGLSQGVLVVEAAPASGSLITARMAIEQGREVFAIPGSIHVIQSRGCHALIKQGAKLVETVEDILEEMPQLVQSTLSNRRSAADETTERCSTRSGQQDMVGDGPLLIALGFDPIGLDALQARTGLPTPDLQVQLLELELEGQVERVPGGLFQRMVRV